MKRKFRHYIEDNQLFSHNSKVLLAVSGGVDSMVMLNLFHQCGFKFSIAHCNFHLRGEESDGDEALVREMAKEINAELFVTHYNTKEYAKQNNLSIQVAARNLRYDWFAELCETKGFDAVAVAHNQNDVAETFLINLARGTGVKGLTGIKTKGNGIVRPLLFATRKEIEKYAKAHKISYRSDSSNADNKYARNRIRNSIIPEFQKLNIAFVQNVVNTSSFAAQAWEVACEEIDNFRKKVRTQATNETHYSIEMLRDYKHRLLFLAEEFIPFGFDSTMIPEIEKSLHSQPGKTFYSADYILVRDRDFLTLAHISEKSNQYAQIQSNTNQIVSPINLSIEIFEKSKNFKVTKSNHEFVFDYHKIDFPVIVRPWKHGDWFVPFGMKGRKKVSDFLVDQKVPVHKKSNVFVLESGGSIVCVLGFRISDKYKVTPDTQRIWKVTINN